jgi:hypothetical protein
MRSSSKNPAAAIVVATVIVAISSLPHRAHAQLGAGWGPTNFTKSIHLDDVEGLQTFSWSPSKSVCTPTVCADYAYDSATDSETFRIFDSRSNRSEIRLQNNYSTGIKQFEGYVTFYEPLHNESLFQIFGNSGSAATYAMMRGYRDHGGEIRVVGGSNVIASGVYGQEVRINMIHSQNQWSKWYVNGQLVLTKSETDTLADNYWKYGVYGTTSGNVPAIVKWRAVRTFRDGLAPDASATPPGAYEAENALLNGPVIASSSAGYTGTGFVDYVNPTGDYVNWTVNTTQAGLYDLDFRYALESGNRPLSIQVNGQTVSAALSFASTGAWDTWTYATIPSLYLPAGTNTIRATAIGSSGPNLDHLLLSAGLDGDLNSDGLLNATDWTKFKSGQGLSLIGMTAAQRYSWGDLNADSVHDLADFARFRASYEDANGTDSFALMLATVPEPTTALIAIVALSFCITLRSKPSRPRPRINGAIIMSRRAQYRAILFFTALLTAFAQTSPTHAVQSQWVRYDATGHLAYQTWGSNGDRIMDFSSAGYMGGGVVIPNSPAKITLNPLAGGADNTQAIQNAINSVAAMPLVNGIRGAVVLNPGTYNISNTINLNSSGVIVRGAGIGQTIVNQLRPDGQAGFLAFDVGGSGSRSTSGQPTANLTAAYVPSGATSFTVSSTAGFNVGDQVVVNRTATAEWIHYVGMDTLVRDGAPQTWISAGTKIPTDRVVKAISGNTITLDAPLTDSFDTTYVGSPVGTISKYTFSGRISQVGLENLTIQNSVPNATGNSINMDDVLDSWVRNVESKENRNAYSIGNDAKRVTWDHVLSNNAVANLESAAPADFAVTGTQILLNKCEQDSEGQWAYVTQARGTGPIVILNSTSSDRGVSPHQRWTTGVLTDGGNMEGTTGVEYSNRTTAGSGHGWTTGWSVAWNLTTPKMKIEAAPGTMNWCIGCTGTVVSTSQPDGIYESLGTKVDLGQTDSLYLEQLRERLGPQALANIGYAPLGDLTGDGLVNRTDWTVFTNGYSVSLAGLTPSQAYALGDLNGDFIHDLKDFAAFRQAYDDNNGSGAFTQMLAAIPEPTTIVAVFIAFVLFPLRNRRPPRRVGS